MTIEFRCAVCEKGFKVDEKHIGRKTICKGCGTTFLVPQAGQSVAIAVGGAPAARPAAKPAQQRSVPSEQLLAVISRHVETHIGPIARVFRDQHGAQKQIDILWVKPGTGRPFHTLISCGMSAQAMKGGAEFPYAELVLCLPPDWPLDETALADEANYWPLRWMKVLSRYAIDERKLMFDSQAYPNGNPPQPLHASTPLAGWMLTQPIFVDSQAALLELPDRSIRFMAMFPLHPNELQFLSKYGYETTLHRLTSTLSVQEGVQPRRRSFVRTKRQTRRRYSGPGIHVQCKCGATESPPLELAGTAIDCYECGQSVYVPCSSRVYGRATQASHPSGIRVQIGNYLKYEPVEALALALPVVILVGMIILIGVIMLSDEKPVGNTPIWAGPAFMLLVVVVTAGVAAHRYYELRSQFQNGNLCPAQVVSLSPPRLAVYTNMTTSVDRRYSVIQIIAHNLKEIDGQPLRIGQRVPTTAYYFGTPQEPTWKLFNPLPVQYGTAEHSAVEYAIAATDPDEWRRLEQGIKEIPTLTKKGYYWLNR